MDQPGKGCQSCSWSAGCPSCSWSAQQGKLIFPCPRSRLRILYRETDSAVPSRVSLLISILTLNLVLTYGIAPEFRGGVIYLFKTAVRHRISPEFFGSRNCVPMAFVAESPSAQGQLTSKYFRTSAGLAGHHGPINIRRFPHPLMV